MQAITDYLTMGGYAAFVWPAYGIAALILIAFAIDSRQRVKRAEAALRKLESDAGNHRRQAPSSASSQVQP